LFDFLVFIGCELHAVASIEELRDHSFAVEDTLPLNFGGMGRQNRDDKRVMEEILQG
jgi:hypothetical protein